MATAKKYPEVRAEMPAKSLSAIKAGFPPATKALERVPSSSKCRNNSALLDEKIQAVSGELAKGLLFAKAAKAREGKRGHYLQEVVDLISSSAALMNTGSFCHSAILSMIFIFPFIGMMEETCIFKHFGAIKL